jgi:hypothetical protein
MSKSKGAERTPKHKWYGYFNEREFLEEMDKSTARSAGIVAASYVENSLALAIMSRLKGLTSVEQTRLFDGYARNAPPTHNKRSGVIFLQDTLALS